MAGIRYKGQVFSGTVSFCDADHVPYDNTQSGLTATDVQGALDEVVASNTWKLYSSTTGGTAISYPADAKEIQIVAVYSSLVYSKILTPLNYGDASFNMGGYIYSTTNFGYAEAHIYPTNQTVRLAILMHAGQNQTSASNFYVFYH